MSGGIVLPIVLALFCVLLAVACFADIRALRIPNWIPFAIAGLFIVPAVGSVHPIEWWASHVAAGCAVLVVGFMIFAWGKIGAGDIKLLAAAALWCGLPLLPQLLLATGLFGGGVALAIIAGRRLGAGVMMAAFGMPLASLEEGNGAPYAVAIAAAGWFLLPQM